ncbi:AAA family ATPase, partial [Francisella tularensis]|uniref:AAA family ATPase n=1 Tax=Francisella tularensis TaxID=263 RepID=UPI002381BBAE
NPNDPVFVLIKKATIRNYNLIIIDEASMIITVLFELIDSEINRSLITKVLFLGDKAQLPPIGDQLSPIFTLENSYQ